MHSPRIDDAGPLVSQTRPVLLLCAIYDGLLGLAFLFFAEPIFRVLGIESTADPIYAQLAAGLIAIMGLGFFLAWRDPLRNRDLVLLGAVFKAFYILLAAYALIRGEVPHPVFLVFAAIDILFLIVFVRFLQGSTAVQAAGAASIVGERGP
jgi:hypothetical protein